VTTSLEPGARWLSCHVDYACRHSGACCRSGWPLPVEGVVVPVIDDAVVRGRLSTVDGRANWLDDTTARRGEIGGTFRQVNGGCVFHAPTAPMTRHGGGRQRYCAVHAALGRHALPSSCQHFPRVCLIDDRGVRVSLSHYCPTAAAMLVDHDGPVAIVDGPPPVPARAVPEGLDVRNALPPRLTNSVLMDLDGLTAWEDHVVETLAGARDEATPEHAVAQVRDDARRLAAWTPASGPTLACTVAELRASGREGDLRGAAEALADATTWPAWFELAASTCQGAWLADDPPNTLVDLDAHYLVPVWPRHAAAVRRYLAAKAFASWIAYQADAAASLAAWLTLCLAVLRIECARACHAASRPLDRELLIQAIRQSDLLLVHYADSLAIAQQLGDRRTRDSGPGSGG
jgi:hypothetical protein